MELWTAAQMKSIERMLNPRSIAIVGASAKGGGYGARLLNAVLKSRDRIPVYPVNPNHAEIMGVPAYRSVSDLPQAPDLVGVVVPYHQVLPVLEECHRKGAGAAVVISAGFAERGDDARLDLERRLAAFTRESGLRIAGPNCLGVANVRDDIWATASSRTLGGLTGPIGLICQSGATAFGPFLMRAVDGGIGLSHIISTGNETDLDFADFARYLLDDPGTRVIAGFVEGFKNFEKFIEVAKLAAERGKPIVLIKIGRSESGSRAARSHTAALTGSDALYDAAFRQYGVTRVNDYDELLEVSQLFAHSRKPVKPGIAAISHSGGISSLTADLCGQHGIDLPPLTDRARDGINAVLKDFGWAANPADVTGFARGENFKAFIDYLTAEPEVGTLVVASSGTGDQVDHLLALRERTEKNIVYFWTGARAEKGSLDRLKAANFPLFYSPEKLARGLRSLLDYHEWRDRRAAAGIAAVPATSAAQQAVLKQMQTSGGAALSEADSRRVIAAWGISGPREERASSIDAAVAAARRIGYPVALKIDSPDIPHKTEAGVVRLDLRDEAAVRAAYGEITAAAAKNAAQAKVSGVLVQEMVAGGVEVIVGVSYDPQIGPMLLFGIGGVMVEIYNDIARRRCPIGRAEALEMIDEVKGAKLLRGFRGRPPADVDALADALVRVSHLAVHLKGQLAELDINPLMVLPTGQGVKAADALVVARR
jgi:acyl-CoA synthetase (NDP forming)